MWNSQQGHPVVAVSDTYEMVLWPGAAQELVVRHPFDRVSLLPEERQWWVALLRSRRGNGDVEVPHYKPAFKSVMVSRTGDLLIHRHTPSELGPGETGEIPSDGLGMPRSAPWQEPLQIDIWSPTGCLREVALGPAGVSPLAASSDTIWASATDDSGRPIVVRYLR